MRPEQIKAREYLYRKGTLLAADEIHKRVWAAFAAFDEFLEGVEAAEARVRPAETDWSVQEVVDHLLETHRSSLEELRCLLSNERPAGGPIPAGLQSSAPLDRPWNDLVLDLNATEREILTILERVPRDFTSGARAPVVLVANVRDPDGGEMPLEWIEELDWKAYAVIFRLHAVDHLKQAQRTLEAVRSRREGPADAAGGGRGYGAR